MTEPVAQLVAKALDFELYELPRPSRRYRIFALLGKNAEGLAMLQALYSRSPKSIKDRIEELAADQRRTATDRLDSLSQKTRDRVHGFLFGDEHASLNSLSEGRKMSLVNLLEAAGSELLAGNDATVREKMAAFMETYYVAYGHKSIGDCGNIVLFIEGVPLHLPTQIQDSALYSGQEASTRYLDMSTAYVWDPIGTPMSAAIQADWMRFYKTSMPRMIDHLLTAHPAQPGQSEATHLRAIKARAFDILGGLLPVGVSTNASWSVNLRQAADHSRFLRLHPDPLVAEMGEDLLSLLKALYAKSFSHQENPASNAWLSMAIAEQIKLVQGSSSGVRTELQVIIPDEERFLRGAEILRTRPTRLDIPRHLRNVATFMAKGRLDFRSLRDLHRHRALDIPVPCIHWTDGTIEPWYLEQLPPDLRAQADALLVRQFERFRTLEADPFILQLYTPLGTMVPYEMRGPIGALIYAMELRSKKDVHPTARMEVWRLADLFAAKLPQIPITIDREPDAFNVKRGEATIIDTRTGQDIGGVAPKEG